MNCRPLVCHLLHSAATSHLLSHTHHHTAHHVSLAQFLSTLEHTHTMLLTCLHCVTAPSEWRGRRQWWDGCGQLTRVSCRACLVVCLECRRDSHRVSRSCCSSDSKSSKPGRTSHFAIGTRRGSTLTSVNQSCASHTPPSSLAQVSQTIIAA